MDKMIDLEVIFNKLSLILAEGGQMDAQTMKTIGLTIGALLVGKLFAKVAKATGRQYKLNFSPTTFTGKPYGLLTKATLKKVKDMPALSFMTLFTLIFDILTSPLAAGASIFARRPLAEKQRMIDDEADESKTKARAKHNAEAVASLDTRVFDIEDRLPEMLDEMAKSRKVNDQLLSASAALGKKVESGTRRPRTFIGHPKKR